MAEPIFVDYCKEAMDLYLVELPKEEIYILSFTLAKMVVSGDGKDMEIIIHKNDENGGTYPVRVPVVSFLRTDTIRNELKSIGIEEYKVDEFIR
jgi:hypothetical protein